MKKLFFIIQLLIAVIPALMAQGSEKPVNSRPINNVSVNFLGDASIISFNYERQILITENYIGSSKIGLGYNEEFCLFCSSAEQYITIPHHLTANLGANRHFFEIGFGGTYFYGNTTRPYVFYPIVGYRLLPLKSNKISFRIFGQYPLAETDIIFIPVGLNLGFSF
jgi:hypothetical protein